MKFAERAKRLTWLDIGLIKWSSIVFGLIIGCLFPDFFKRYLWVMIILCIGLGVRPGYRFWKK